jgi:integrase
MGSAWLTPAGASWLNGLLRVYERRAGTAHFTVHDLRRTASTHLTEMGWAAEVVEKALGHELRNVRGVYNRAEFAEQRRAMLEAWAVQLERLRRNG